MVSDPRRMICAEVDELAGAYALNALEAEEYEAVEAHLESCSQDHTALWQARETAAMLAALAPAARSPEQLRSRVLAAVATAAPIAGPQPTPLGGEPSEVIAIRRLPGIGAVALALAAAFALLAVGLGAWALSLRNDLHYERAQSEGGRAVLTALTAPGTAVQLSPSGALPPALLVQPSDGSAAMLVFTWPRAGQGKIYQAWTIPPGQKPVSAGIFDGAGSETEVATLTKPVAANESFAVTLEPAGGSDQPTTQPLLLRPKPS